MPFGKRLGNQTDHRKAYPALFDEWARLVTTHNGRMVLLTHDVKGIQYAMRACANYWTTTWTRRVNPAGLNVTALALKRTSTTRHR